MKVLIVTRNISNVWGGFEEHIYNLFWGLLKNNIKTYLLTTDLHPLPKRKFPKRFLIVVKNFLKLFGYGYFDRLALFKNIKKINPDLIHVHGWGSFIVEKTITYSEKNEIPCILTPHEFFHKISPTKLLYNHLFKKYYLSKPSVVIALNKKQMLEIKNYSKKVEKIPNGINPKEFLALKPRCKGYILSVGRFERYKGFDEVLNLSKKTGKKVVLAGNFGSYYSSLKKRIKSERINAKILLNVSRKRLLDLYSSANVFINPSHREGFGITTLEALASGTPVISRPVGIACDISSKYCKKYTKFDELIDLTEKLWNVKNKEKLEISKFRDKIINTYSWSKVIKKHIMLYKSVLK